MLRTFSICNCPLVTDVSLQHIADHAGSRLEVLHTDIKQPASSETDAILDVFARKCSVLTYLNVNCYNMALCSGKGLSPLVTGCPKLHTLVVNKESTIGGTSRYFIGMFRPTLKLLVHDSSTVYDVYACVICICKCFLTVGFDFRIESYRAL